MSDQDHELNRIVFSVAICPQTHSTESLYAATDIAL